MKKMKVFATIGAMLLTCSMVSTYASTSGWKEVRVGSGNAVNVATGYKSTNTALAGAWLSAIGEPDTIIYWAYESSSSGGLLASWNVMESSSPNGTTYNSGKYVSGTSSSVGKGVEVIAKSKNFSFGTYPIQTQINFY